MEGRQVRGPLPRAYRYYTFAREFGWTPRQVDEQPGYVLDWLAAIAGAHGEVQSKSTGGGVNAHGLVRVPIE